jgi:hypothetical protein
MSITNNLLLFPFPKTLIIFCFSLCIWNNSPILGQNLSNLQADTTAKARAIFTKRMSIGVNLGIVNGIGVDIAYRFREHWAAKMAFNYADYTKKGFIYTIDFTSKGGVKEFKNLSFDAAIKLSNLAFNVEYMPKTNGQFRFIGGLSYFYQNTLTLGAQAISIFKVNDVELTPEDIGSGSIEVGFDSKIAPFVGLGFGKTFPKKRVNMNFELGTYYKTPYKVAIRVQPGIFIKRNEENAATLTRNFNEKWYGKFFPVINMRVAVPIGSAKY